MSTRALRAKIVDDEEDAAERIENTVKAAEIVTAYRASHYVRHS